MVICGIGFWLFSRPRTCAPLIVERGRPTASGKRQRAIVAHPARPEPGKPSARRWPRCALHSPATMARRLQLALGAGFAALGSVLSFLRLAVGVPRKDMISRDRGNRATFQPADRSIFCCCIRPRPVPQTVWDMPTEYPENAMPGVGLTAFAKHVAEIQLPENSRSSRVSMLRRQL